MRLVRDDLHPAEEGGVVHRRRDLADAAADRVLEPTVEDLRRGEEPAGLRPLSHHLVEVERLAREDDRPVDDVGSAVDVVHARRAARVVRRELGDLLLDAERPGPLRGECGLRDPEPGEMRLGTRVAQERRTDRLPVERTAGTRRRDAHALPGRHEPGVPRRPLEAPEPGTERRLQAPRVERHREGSVDRLRAHELPEPLRPERGRHPPEPHDARPGEEPLHLFLRRLGLRRGHAGSGGDERQADLGGERAQRTPQLTSVDAGSRCCRPDPNGGLAHDDVGIARRVCEALVERVGEPGDPHRPQRVLERELPGLAEAEPSPGPLERARVPGSLDRLVDERLGAELRARRARLAAGPEQPDRQRRPLAARELDLLGRGLLLQATDRDATDRRPCRDLASVREPEATVRSADQRPHGRERRHDDERGATAPASAADGGDEGA